MRIEYVAAGRWVTVRIVEWREWRPENGHVCEVECAEDAADLLTMPGPDGRPEFAVAGDEPLRMLECLGADVAALALAGIANLVEVAGLDEESVQALAAAGGWKLKRVAMWVDAARRSLGSSEQAEGGDSGV